MIESGVPAFALSTSCVSGRQDKKVLLVESLGKQRKGAVVTSYARMQQGQQKYSKVYEMTRRKAIQSIVVLVPLGFMISGANGTKAAVEVKETGGDDSLSFNKLPCEGEGCRSVEICDYRTGSGRTVERGSTIVLKWTGRLADRYGWPFQREPDEYTTLHVSNDELIEGFVQGILGMQEGGKRRIVIPTALGYHDEIHGPLPADFGDRRRLFATVLNNRRFKNAGDLVIDVQLKKVGPANLKGPS